MFSYVYILRFVNKKLYIGVSVNPKRRVVEHLRENKIVGHAAKKYGIPELLIVWSGLRVECFEYEQYLVDALSTIIPNGYNLQRGGEGGSVPSTESRAKMATARIGCKLSIETRQRMVESHKKRKPISKETRNKLSKAAKNRKPISKATRIKLSLAGQGRYTSHETRKKLSDAARHQWAQWRAEKSHQSV